MGSFEGRSTKDFVCSAIVLSTCVAAAAASVRWKQKRSLQSCLSRCPHAKRDFTSTPARINPRREIPNTFAQKCEYRIAHILSPRHARDTPLNFIALYFASRVSSFAFIPVGLFVSSECELNLKWPSFFFAKNVCKKSTMRAISFPRLKDMQV